jgi:hypothetical protein
MFVASRVESGNEGGLALLPQFTGYIQAATGCGTLSRANGCVQVMVMILLPRRRDQTADTGVSEFASPMAPCSACPRAHASS